MNGDIDTRPELADYLNRVRAALSDLPADELAEVMEDVEPHVTEVFGEADSAEEVVERLGTPEAYAAELRAAGGYPATPTPATAPGTGPGRRWGARYVVWMTGLTVLVAGITGIGVTGSHSGERYAALTLCALLLVPAAWLVFTGRVGRADVEARRSYRVPRAFGLQLLGMVPQRARDYLRTLQPAWWLARFVLLGLAFLAAIGQRAGGIVAILAVAAVFVWSAPRVRTDRRHLLVVVPANALLIGLSLGLAVAVISWGDRSSAPVYSSRYYSDGLVYNGSSLSNVYAVDAQGRAIPEFYLYDEEGNPLNVDRAACSYETEPPSREEPRNRFPQPRVEYGRTGCVEETGLPFMPLPPVSGSVTTTTTAQAPGSPGASTPVVPTGVTTTPPAPATSAPGAPVVTTTTK